MVGINLEERPIPFDPCLSRVDVGGYYLNPDRGRHKTITKNAVTKQKLKTIIYPIQPNAIIEIFSDDSQIVNNDFSLVLRKDGILFNFVNDMSVYLTETESSIIEWAISEALG